MSSGYVDDAEQMPATAPANSVSNVFKLFLPSDSDRSHCMENRVRSLEREKKKKEESHMPFSRPRRKQTEQPSTARFL